MREDGGFEGNGQTLRILSRHENFSENAGANLSRRTLLGVLKYPASYTSVKSPLLNACLFPDTTAIKIIDKKKSKPPKCYLDGEDDIVNWILDPVSAEEMKLFKELESKPGKHAKTIHKSLDCSIMDIADDIAYGVHDLEDAIALKLISEKSFREKIQEDVCQCFLVTIGSSGSTAQNDKYEQMVNKLFGDSNSRKHYISKLVHHFVSSIKLEEINTFSEPLLRYRATMYELPRIFLDAFQSLVVQDVITSPSVQHLEFKGQTMVVAVFEAINADPERLLPRENLSLFNKPDGGARAICDYVAGMTDNYLLRTYERLFSPRMGSVFDKL